MRLILVDESKRKDYILCAVEIDLALAPAARVALNQLRLKGQRSIHFAKESDSRRMNILKSLLTIPSITTCYVVKGLNRGSEGAVRQLCVMAMIAELGPSEQYKVIFDLDENFLAADRLTLGGQLRSRQNKTQVIFHHLEPYQEQLLALPDAFAWAFARGGRWRLALRSLDLRIKYLT